MRSPIATVAVMTTARAFAAALLACAPLAAHAQIYRCEGPDGVVEYSNSPTTAQTGRNCRVVELAPITTIPAPQPRSAAPAAARPAAPGAATPGRAAAVPPAPSARPPGAEGFPRVDPATQRSRDSDRRRILEDELRKEETKLAELRKEYNDGEPERLGGERNYQKYLDRVERLKEDIARSEANLATIRRELSAIRN